MTAAASTAPSASGLSSLADLAAQRKLGHAGYGGEVTPGETWSYLRAHAEAVLVDVRTQPEWEFTGLPDASGAAGRLLTISWKVYPSYAINAQFAHMLEREGVTPQTPLFFICRSGGRSLDAAAAMTARGYRYCFNVTGGFEGKPNSQGHRCMVEGWKASQLPWKQG